jgi:hypothetical protein
LISYEGVLYDKEYGWQPLAAAKFELDRCPGVQHLRTAHCFKMQVATAHYFNFIPRLPTKAAWDTRLINGAFTLKDIIAQLNARIAATPSLRFRLRGVIHYKDDKELTQFSGVKDLEIILSEAAWNPNTIRKIYFYDHGYVMVATE